MFYKISDGHPFAHDPFKAIVSPRPIGWISTVSKDGQANLAPYSFFNAVAGNPPVVMFAPSGTKPGGATKDSLRNIRETGGFCVNVASYALRDAMNDSSAPFGDDVDEFGATGLTALPCEMIDAPRVGAAPASLECTLFKEVDLPGNNRMIIGEVVGVHIDEGCVRDGRFDVTSFGPLTRLGYHDYAVTWEVFEMPRPTTDPAKK
ncbi:flavin reductase family protein [Paracoccaceae bacterium GXU_MW_L88]